MSKTISTVEKASYNLNYAIFYISYISIQNSLVHFKNKNHYLLLMIYDLLLVHYYLLFSFIILCVSLLIIFSLIFQYFNLFAILSVSFSLIIHISSLFSLSLVYLTLPLVSSPFSLYRCTSTF